MTQISQSVKQWEKGQRNQIVNCSSLTQERSGQQIPPICCWSGSLRSRENHQLGEKPAMASCVELQCPLPQSSCQLTAWWLALHRLLWEVQLKNKQTSCSWKGVWATMNIPLRHVPLFRPRWETLKSIHQCISPECWSWTLFAGGPRQGSYQNRNTKDLQVSVWASSNNLHPRTLSSWCHSNHSLLCWHRFQCKSQWHVLEGKLRKWL